MDRLHSTVLLTDLVLLSLLLLPTCACCIASAAYVFSRFVRDGLTCCGESTEHCTQLPCGGVFERRRSEERCAAAGDQTKIWMSRAAREGARPPWVDGKAWFEHEEMCVVNAWYWGTRASIALDVAVLGGSLKSQKVAARKVCCVHEQSIHHPFVQIMEAFWDIQLHSSIDLPQHLRNTEMDRLAGVYDKLQAWWQVQAPCRDDSKKTRVLVLDGDMLVQGSLSELWEPPVPAAVDRGERDQSALNPRPSSSYFPRPSSHTRPGEMVGGKNGGLMMFDPRSGDYESISMEALAKWSPVTNMAEQEFLSYLFAVRGEWNSAPKKFNVQVHRVFLTAGRQYRDGARTASNEFQIMLEDMRKAAITHYSAHRKPSNMVMEEEWVGRPWNNFEGMTQQQFDEMHQEHCHRMQEKVKNSEEEMTVLRTACEVAHRAWVNTYETTWMERLKDVLGRASRQWRMVDDAGDVLGDIVRWRCPLCEELVETRMPPSGQKAEDFQCMRDRIFVNCPIIRREVTFTLDDRFEMQFLFCLPHGSLVRKLMLYFGQVRRLWKGKSTGSLRRPPRALPGTSPPILEGHLRENSVTLGAPLWLTLALAARDRTDADEGDRPVDELPTNLLLKKWKRSAVRVKKNMETAAKLVHLSAHPTFVEDIRTLDAVAAALKTRDTRHVGARGPSSVAAPITAAAGSSVDGMGERTVAPATPAPSTAGRATSTSAPSRVLRPVSKARPTRAREVAPSSAGDPPAKRLR